MYPIFFFKENTNIKKQTLRSSTPYKTYEEVMRDYEKVFFLKHFLLIFLLERKSKNYWKQNIHHIDEEINKSTNTKLSSLCCKP